MGAKAPWYIINQERDKFRFICAAVLAPAIRTLAAGEGWKLRYRVAVKPTPWTQDGLVEAPVAWH